MRSEPAVAAWKRAGIGPGARVMDVGLLKDGTPFLVLELLEGLDLSKVAPGHYDLIALPLRIEGADGAPTRAVLRRRKRR